ncbi:Utp21-domain-containing protein [Artomyces pyxidatus]|uniref:Utp21-domain-containing protein n=1 Tax=Artomyces pyxidatus TaxID=48021 RepID=A0ACB8T0U5_9AGAM|nr:Utp21-domain-containing protein [Artomyces pyxidatus]
MAARTVVVTQDDVVQPPPRKRIRAEASERPKTSPPAANPNRLFAPFRALGLITNHVPFVLQSRTFKGATDGPRIHLLTCLGTSWALWDGGKMGLLFVGPEAPDTISSMVMDGDAVWAACGPHVLKYMRGKEASTSIPSILLVARLTNPLQTPLASILIFGTQLLALTEDGGKLLVWDIAEEIFQSQIHFEPGFTATHMLHPATYLNKILVGSSDGSLQLWNIRTQTCIHQFPSSSLLASSTTVTGITALAQSPAIDVVGIGFASGEISVYDVRADERLIRVFIREGGVRALSFRSDGHPVLATASEAGHISLWDLSANGRLLHTVRGAHDGGITAMEWMPGQPVLVTSGEDNSVKQWLFDSPTSPPRLLKFRSGHHTPPHLIRYYGEDGKQLLTASRDRSLRCTSVVRDSRSFELSQGSLAKKATSLSIPLASLKYPPVTAMAFSTTRSKDWDDILTAHTDETFARTWNMLQKKKGKYALGFTDGGKGKVVGSVKAVCVSACGNFGLASTSTGLIHMWNMQSGLQRKTFSIGQCPPDVATKFRPPQGKKRGDERSVTGLATDALNRVVIASTLDGTVNFFDFHAARLEATLIIPTSIVSMSLHRDSNLLALISDDHVVRLVDIETRRIVREFNGFGGRVLDLTFSPDSRWIITTSLDSTIRTFDIPTGRLIDAFRTPSVATSISFSPSSDFLATSHVDSVGVYLWANRAQYSDVSFRSVAEDDIENVALPTMQGTAEDDGDTALDALSALTMHDTPQDLFSTPAHLDGDLVTLTLLPRSRWQTLLNLDVIQQRNKPTEPPKAPEKAPFFLPTLPGVESRFVVQEKEQEPQKPTRRLEKAAAETESIFFRKLTAEVEDGDYETFFAFAKSLSPAAVDLELRSLVTLDALRLFVHALTQRLKSRRDFEAVQTYLNVFLRMHGDVLVENVEVRADLGELLTLQRRESDRVLDLIASSLGTLAFVRDTL